MLKTFSQLNVGTTFVDYSDGENLWRKSSNVDAECRSDDLAGFIVGQRAAFESGVVCATEPGLSDDFEARLRLELDPKGIEGQPMPDILRGERWIVIDKHGRALTQYTEAGASRIKLELPPHDLHGVSFFDKGVAGRYVMSLQETQPAFGPFVVWDIKDWQQAQIARNKVLLQEISLPERTPAFAHDDGPSI